LKLFIGFGVCAGSLEIHAQPKKAGWVKATVITDGAAVYQTPNFDSAVQEYLSYQTQVLVSKNAYVGVGGLGLFHKVQAKGRSGFVADTDIRVTKVARERNEEETSAKANKSSSKAWEKEEEEALGKAPLYFTRYLGAALAMVNFTEKFSGQKLSDDMLMYGLRMSGPGTLFDGPPLDVNVWFSMQKPGYYSRFSNGSPTGFMMFGDVMIQLPFIDAKRTLVTYGLGAMWTYTRYSVPVKNVTFDSQEFRMGAVAGVGLGQKFGKFMLRGDVKYYYEKAQYFGYLGSFQMEY
jgi:hypothetical protein